MSADKFEDYVTKPVAVKAYQIHHFYVWSSFLVLIRQGVICYFVPKGNPHPLRNAQELDHDDNPYADAAPFIVLSKTGGGEERVNPTHYVVQSADGYYYALDPTTFEEGYVKGTLL